MCGVGVGVVVACGCYMRVGWLLIGVVAWLARCGGWLGVCRSYVEVGVLLYVG